MRHTPKPTQYDPEGGMTDTVKNSQGYPKTQDFFARNFWAKEWQILEIPYQHGNDKMGNSRKFRIGQ